MKYIYGLFFGFSFLFSSSIFANVLVLSDKMQMKYDQPLLISHTEDTLIFKYSDWRLIHEVVDPKNVYPKIDLSGMDRLFFLSIFDAEQRKKLPKWLSALAEEQAIEFGVKDNNVKRSKIGIAEIVSVYNDEKGYAHAYLFEEVKIHHFVIYGDKSKFDNVVSSIGVR